MSPEKREMWLHIAGAVCIATVLMGVLLAMMAWPYVTCPVLLGVGCLIMWGAMGA